MPKDLNRYYKRRYTNGQNTRKMVLNTKEIQNIRIKILTRYRFIPTRMANILRTYNTKCHEDVEQLESHPLLGKMSNVQVPWRT